MRLMLRFTIPVERGNEAEADGSLSLAIKELIEKVQPEAAYFHLQDGMRAGTVVFEETDQARLAMINAPLFAKLNAAIEIQPAVSMQELMDKL